MPKEYRNLYKHFTLVLDTDLHKLAYDIGICTSLQLVNLSWKISIQQRKTLDLYV